jgi:hypothetical protein
MFGACFPTLPGSKGGAEMSKSARRATSKPGMKVMKVMKVMRVWSVIEVTLRT